jgi:hypothetical protein
LLFAAAQPENRAVLKPGKTHARKHFTPGFPGFFFVLPRDYGRECQILKNRRGKKLPFGILEQIPRRRPDLPKGKRGNIIAGYKHAPFRGL